MPASTLSDGPAAVAALRRGDLAVLPTETVYGLAADATNPAAVARIYAVKGRPADHPLILHIASAERVDQWASAVPDWARTLISAAWPGPLTVVLCRSSRVGDWVTGGQDTVAIRVPDHPLTLEILASFGGAVAAPSANRFGHVSPTTAAHVVADLAGCLDASRDVIVDGGACRVGIESTIVDCTGLAPAVLRPGRFSVADIERLSGVHVRTVTGRPAHRVSGTLTSHYAPTASVTIAAAPPDDAAGSGLIAGAEVATPAGMVRLMAPGDVADYARRLYWALREADALRVSRVYAIAPQGSDGLAVAVRDRLARAAAGSGPQP